LSIGALSDVAIDDADAGEMKTMPGLTADTDGDDDAANKNKTLSGCDTITKTNRVRHGHGALLDHQVRADHQLDTKDPTPSAQKPRAPGPRRDHPHPQIPDQAKALEGIKNALLTRY